MVPETAPATTPVRAGIAVTETRDRVMAATRRNDPGGFRLWRSGARVDTAVCIARDRATDVPCPAL